jgi:hypothetical protein
MLSDEGRDVDIRLVEDLGRFGGQGSLDIDPLASLVDRFGV